MCYHVSNELAGDELAKEFRLPKVILKDMISTASTSPIYR
jgi:hypothetical protein